ncbi:MAG: 5'/3'-nucleotidase SurE [Nitrospirota bacterium]
MSSKPRILISNDDGVHSLGLKRLAEALRAIGDVTVVAPDGERNAASHAITLHKPLRVTQLADGVYSTSGTPTDCINLGVITILKERPALVVSGINLGENLADDVTYSGTVSAAMEGTLLGIPSIAVSQAGEGAFQFDAAAEVAVQLAEAVLEQGLPRDTLLNVNVPDLKSADVRGVKITRLGRRSYDANDIIENRDPRGRKYYWIGGNRMFGVENEGTDFGAVQAGYISVSPVHLDLTNYSALSTLATWEPRLSRSAARRAR